MTPSGLSEATVARSAWPGGHLAVICLLWIPGDWMWEFCLWAYSGIASGQYLSLQPWSLRLTALSHFKERWVLFRWTWNYLLGPSRTLPPPAPTWMIWQPCLMGTGDALSCLSLVLTLPVPCPFLLTPLLPRGHTSPSSAWGTGSQGG